MASILKALWVETERLQIRVPETRDVDALGSAIFESRSELRRWLPWATKNMDRVDVEQFINTARSDFESGRDHQFLMLTHEGILVGACGVHHGRRDPSLRVPLYEIGYWCRASLWGKGYATEAVRGVTDHAFVALKAKRIEIWCDTRNRASIRVAEKAGFRKEGTLRSSARNNQDELADMHVYAKLAV